MKTLSGSDEEDGPRSAAGRDDPRALGASTDQPPAASEAAERPNTSVGGPSSIRPPSTWRNASQAEAPVAIPAGAAESGDQKPSSDEGDGPRRVAGSGCRPTLGVSTGGPSASRGPGEEAVNDASKLNCDSSLKLAVTMVGAGTRQQLPRRRRRNSTVGSQHWGHAGSRGVRVSLELPLWGKATCAGEKRTHTAYRTATPPTTVGKDPPSIQKPGSDRLQRSNPEGRRMHTKIPARATCQDRATTKSTPLPRQRNETENTQLTGLRSATESTPQPGQSPRPGSGPAQPTALPRQRPCRARCRRLIGNHQRFIVGVLLATDGSLFAATGSRATDGSFAATGTWLNTPTL